MSRFKVRARSVIHPGNYLLEDSNGCCYIYFADVGELSAAGIDSSLADAMVQSYEWSCPNHTEWITRAELESRASAPVPSSVNAEDISHPGD